MSSEPRRRFRFLKQLSEGSFGRVYLSEMITADNFSTVVAIKLLHGKWAGNEEIVMRSRDEARLLGRLRHTNIVRVEDLTSINGQCAIVMEYLDGVDLKYIITHANDNDLQIPRQAIFEMVGAIASAMDAAYNHVPLQGGDPLRVIHRDIKPSNAMVTDSGEIKVLDFGTAQANFEDREAKTEALSFGSQAYMAPERLLGDPDHPSGDVFSLGVTLYELLAQDRYGSINLRQEKFEADLLERVQALDLSSLEDGFAEQVRKLLFVMLSYEPDRRLTASQVIELMDAFAEEAHDGSMRRFCREVVPAAKGEMPSNPFPNDPLHGSTLFEDGSHVFGGDEVLDGGVPPEPTQETTAPVVDASAPSPATPVPTPAKKSGGSGKIIGIVVALLAIGGGAAAFLLGGEKQATTAPVQEISGEPGTDAALTAPSSDDLGSGQLTLIPPGGAGVTVQNIAHGFKKEWDGTKSLNLEDVEPGNYITKIALDGRTVRATLQIEAGKACKYAYKVSDKSTEWEQTSCD